MVGLSTLVMQCGRMLTILYNSNAKRSSTTGIKSEIESSRRSWSCHRINGDHLARIDLNVERPSGAGVEIYGMDLLLIGPYIRCGSQS